MTVIGADHVTVLRAVDGAVLTKRTRRALDGEFLVAAYDSGFWFAVEEVPVNDLLDLGALLARLERDPRACVIRGQPLPGTDLRRCWRLLYDTTDDDGRTRGATFEPASRRWQALDFDDLPTPTWNEDDLVRRREAIAGDRAQVGQPHPKTEDDGEDIDLAGDDDPAPIGPARDWPLVCRAAVSTLPPEFADASAWWQMTSSAGIKPGIRLRMWFWCDHPLSDAECKRRLADAPVDRSLYSPVQVHYVAAPIFDPPGLDPVPLRSGFFWQHRNTIAVPELPEPEFAPVHAVVSGNGQRSDDAPPTCRAEAYAKAALRGVATAAAGNRHPTLMSVAVRLFSLADIGLLDPGEITRALLAAAAMPLSPAERRQRCTRYGNRPSANEHAIDWARAKARAAPDLPDGFSP